VFSFQSVFAVTCQTRIAKGLTIEPDVGVKTAVLTQLETDLPAAEITAFLKRTITVHFTPHFLCLVSKGGEAGATYSIHRHTDYHLMN